MSISTMGFVGVGRMGGPMSQRLIDAGHSLCVFDTSAEAVAALKTAGATIASSPQDVGNNADIVFVSLPTPSIVQSVVLDGVGRGTRAKTIVDLSTSGPAMAGRVSAALKERGVAWIDAPVSGGISGAKAGTLAIMASGPAHKLRYCRTAAEKLREGLLRRRKGWARPGGKARQQSPCRSSLGRFLGSPRDGREGRPRSQGHARHY